MRRASRFGNGSAEANRVYPCALPPLVLPAFVTGRATALSDWARTIGPVSDTATWFNFLASHDGIGIRNVYLGEYGRVDGSRVEGMPPSHRAPGSGGSRRSAIRRLP